eukprot:97511-Pyramimonas_sp.AAC.1
MSFTVCLGAGAMSNLASRPAANNGFPRGSAITPYQERKQTTANIPHGFRRKNTPASSRFCDFDQASRTSIFHRKSRHSAAKV